MDALDLHQYHVADETVRAHLAAGRIDAASAAASTPCDRAACHLARGEIVPAVQLIQEAVQRRPDSHVAFHNLVSTLGQAGQLRGRNLASVCELLRSQADAPWSALYERLLWEPSFLNVQFVAGKCNLKCRMCVGTNSDAHPNKLRTMDVETFRALLAVAPTIDGLTLSSGDSDPLLHPRLPEMIEIARERGVRLNIYTNGLPLGERTARAIVASKTVSAINFSIDAATPETYRTIRGADLGRVLEKIELLRRVQREMDAGWPVLSMSFVAMRDNVHELPEFVRLSARLGAARVFVDDLIGWLDEDHGNVPATEHPRCFEHVEEAKRLAAETKLELALPERLRPAAPAAATPEPDRAELPCCGWLDGVWVNDDGKLEPCCLVGKVADMGSVHDGPLLRNDKYAAVKAQLMSGKVFRPCAEQRMCEYVQQQLTAGHPLRYIERDDLGALWVEPKPVALTVGAT